MKLLTNNVEKFISQKVAEMPAEQVYYEDVADKTTLKQLQEIFRYDPFFHEMMFGSNFEKLASILLGDDVTGKNLQYFNKPPRISQPTPPHQDGFYFKLVPNEAVTMWLALEEVDEENGYVRYVKGSHLRELRYHQKTGVLGFSQGITDFGTADDKENEIFFPAKAGDFLVYHSLTIHLADGNTSASRSRKTMGLIYYAKKAIHDAEAHAAYQEQLKHDPIKEYKLEV